MLDRKKRFNFAFSGAMQFITCTLQKRSEDDNFLSAHHKNRRLVFYRESYVQHSLSAVYD